MGNVSILLVLAIAAGLEAGGDALVRNGLHTPFGVARFGFMAAGAAVLFAYGITVNLPPWDFGRLLGVYVVLFFLAAQLINFFIFGHGPAASIYVGGGLILTGGLVITLWRPA